MTPSIPRAGGQEPLVSIVIAAHNAGGFILKTCESACRQSYRNIEVIVVDDGSVDDTPDIVLALCRSDPRMRLIRQENQGVAAARNRAIAAARGDFIAPLDADDLWDPEKLERQVARMETGGDAVGLVYCWWAWIDEDGLVLDRSPRWRVEGRALSELLEVNFTGSASGPLFRASLLRQVGGYSSDLRNRRAQGCEDWDLALRVVEISGVGVVPEVLLGYRRTPKSMSTDRAQMWRSHVEVMRVARERNTEIQSEVFHRSAAQFALHLAGVAYWSRDYRDALLWGLRAGPGSVVRGAAPSALRLLLRRLFRRRHPLRPLVLDGGAFDRVHLPEPLMPYDEIVGSRWRRSRRTRAVRAAH